MSGECYTEFNPFMIGCSSLFGGWAVGSIGVAFLEETALALPSYVVLEIHYDNPSRKGKSFDKCVVNIPLENFVGYSRHHIYFN